MNVLKGFFADLYSVVPFTGRWILSYTAELAAACRLFATLVFEFADANNNDVLPALRSGVPKLFLLLVNHPVQLILTSVALVLHAIANLINRTTLSSVERGLNEKEKQYLYAIFSDNLQFDKIRIQFGGVKEYLKISPQAVGHEIFLRKKWGTQMYNDDLSLSSAGMRLLGHEVCHVWQSQHMGARYIGDSLITQISEALGRRLNIYLSHGYNVIPVLRDHTPYENCNVEQQAVIAELIGASCAAVDAKVLTKAQFCKVSGIALNDKEFAGVTRAHRFLQQSAPKVPQGL